MRPTIATAAPMPMPIFAPAERPVSSGAALLVGAGGAVVAAGFLVPEEVVEEEASGDADVKEEVGAGAGVVVDDDVGVVVGVCAAGGVLVSAGGGVAELTLLVGAGAGVGVGVGVAAGGGSAAAPQKVLWMSAMAPSMRFGAQLFAIQSRTPLWNSGFLHRQAASPAGHPKPAACGPVIASRHVISHPGLSCAKATLNTLMKSRETRIPTILLERMTVVCWDL